MTKRSVSFALAILAFGITNADVGSKWPDASEMAKAPAWPKAFRGDPNQCKKIEPEAFLSKVNETLTSAEDKYQIQAQVDLNLDGVCEVVAYQPVNCGKWCLYQGFVLRNGKYVSLGEVAPGEYLEPFNGWLQIKTSSYTGPYYFFHLLRFEKGEYKYHRRDEYKEIEIEEKTKYTRTLEGLELESSGKSQ